MPSYHVEGKDVDYQAMLEINGAKLSSKCGKHCTISSALHELV
jgi:hypothetical protein